MVGWPVILSPSGTHMKHDGRTGGRIFHCQSDGDMVIYFSLSLLLSLCIFPHFVFSNPFTCCRTIDNLIIPNKARACRGRGAGGGLSNQPIYRALPTDTEEERGTAKQKVQKADEASEPASFSGSSLTHAHAYMHT